MNYKLLLLLLLLLLAKAAHSQTVLVQESFETTGEGTRYTSNAFDGRSSAASVAGAFPYFTRALTNPLVNPFNPAYVCFGTNSYPVTIGNVTGSVFWAGEAVESSGTNPASTDRPAGVVTLNPIDASKYGSLQLTVALADARGPSSPTITPGGMNPQYEANDVIRLQYSVDGGATYNTIGQFLGNGAIRGTTYGYMQLDANRDGTITSADGAQSSTNTLDINLRDFSFSIPGSPAALLVRVQIDQRGASEELAFDNIRVTGVPNTVAPPVLAGIESTSLPYAEGQNPVQLTNTLTITNAGGPTLTGATVSISSGRVGAQDRLLFTNTGTITGSFNTGTGVLTLVGTASTAAYQAALRSVQYDNIDDINATDGTRVVQFVVANGSATSSPVARSVVVTSALNAPAPLPYADDFTDDGQGARYAANSFYSSASAQFARVTAAQPQGAGYATFSNFSGPYWYAVNTNNVVNPSRLGYLVTQQVNTAGYYNLAFTLRLGASSSAAATWQANDYFRASYRVGGSGPWVAFLSFQGTATTTSGPGLLRRDGNPAGTALTPALTDVTVQLPATLNGELLDFRLEVVNDDVNAELAFDNLRVTGSPVVAPTVTTAAAGAITTTSATLGGNVTADGGAAVTERGVVYLAGTGTPTTSNTKVQLGTGTGSFAQSVTGLAPGTTYAVRAYAVNSVGTSYGSTVAFTTPPNAPIITAPANGAVLSTRTPTYSGTTQAGSTVTVYVDESPIGSVSASGGNFVFTQPTSLADGSHTVYARAAVGGSGASAASATNAFRVDATAPTVTSLSSSAGASGSATPTSPFPFSVSFSESVAGLPAGGISVTNGTVTSGPSAGAGGTYTFGVTPTTPNLPTTVQVVANATRDDAGNGNAASATYTLTYATRTTWTGTVSTDWFTAGNWTAGVPTATLDATIPAGATRYPALGGGAASVRTFTLAAGAALTQTAGTLDVSGDWLNGGTATLSGGTVQLSGTAATTLGGAVPTTFTNLTVASSGVGVTLGQSPVVTGTLTLRSGTLSTGSYLLTLGSTATLSETDASYVLGRVATTRTLAPGASESFGGLGLTLAPAQGSVAPGSTPVVRTTGTVLAGAGGSQSILRYFDIQPATDRGLNVDMTFGYFAHELNGIAAANLLLFKATSTTGPWANLGRSAQTSTADGGTVSRAGITDFSIWTLGSSANPLPVELVNFAATRQGPAAVQLAWTTASEVNSAYFEVERSTTGAAFTALGRVAALGSSSAAHQYAFADVALPAGAATLYYRLRQVDQSGDAHYSPVRVVAAGGAEALALFPNPARSAVQVQGASPGAPVQVLDALGRVVLSATTDALGAARLALPTGLASGVYTVRAGSSTARLAVE